MLYAPVVIWTLNRVNHLKRCIESLEKNSYAHNTELFISVDYPPSIEYEKGYQRVKEYLANKPLNFKNVYVFYQRKNLGPLDNYNFIIKQAFNIYDRIIITEDDNEFSPYFLEYMDSMLNKYENDETIFAIGGYSYPVKWRKDGSNFVKVNNMFSAWGSGFWRKKYENCLENLKRKKIDILMNDTRKVINIWKNSPKAFCNLITSYLNKSEITCNKNGDFLPEDIILDMYLIWKGQYVIIPKDTQVVNHGYDGSGVHCTIKESISIKRETKWEKVMVLDIESEVKFHKENCRKIKEAYPVSFRDAISNWKQYIFFRCHFNN